MLYSLLGVASATAHKALRWMHEEGIVGYYAGKNGAGIRIFINRAAGSIGVRKAATGKKILPFACGSNEWHHGSPAEPAFNDSFAVSEVLEKDLNPRAPKNGAESTEMINNCSGHRSTLIVPTAQNVGVLEDIPLEAAIRLEAPVDEIVSRLSRVLEPSLHATAKRAAAREHELTREWLESKGLPKAARVAQRETYNVLRKYGMINESIGTRPANAGICRKETSTRPHPLTDEEVEDLAQACIAMLKTQGQAIEHTIAEMDSEKEGSYY